MVNKLKQCFREKIEKFVKLNRIIIIVICSLFVTGVFGYKDYVGDSQKNFVVAMQSSAPGTAQVFFDVGNGYNQLDSCKIQIQPEDFKKYIFPVTGQTIKSIRFDPINVPALVRLKDARIEDKQGEVIKNFPIQDFRPMQQISKMETSDGVLILQTAENATDPIITIENSSVGNQFSWQYLLFEHGWKYLVYALLSFLCLIGLNSFVIAFSGKNTIVSTINRNEDYRDNRHFYPDFIRAFAICLIMLYHFDLHALKTRTAESLLFGTASNSFGHIGVSLFIILSGAVLMLNYERNFNVLTYLKKRFLSIYPLFWITYIFFFTARLVVDHSIPEAHLWTFLLTIGGMDGFMLYKLPNFYIMGEWFLGMIIILYLIFPFLRTAFLKYKYFTLLSCLCLAVLIQRFYQFDMDVSRFPLSRLLEFVLGMSFIRLFDDSENKVLNFLLIGIAGTLFYYVSALNLPFLLKMPAIGIIAFTGLASVSRLFFCTSCQTIIIFLSSYSYGAFLSHHVIIVQVTRLFQNKHLAFLPECLLLCLCLVLAYGLSFVLTHLTKIVVSSTLNKLPFRQ